MSLVVGLLSGVGLISAQHTFEEYIIESKSGQPISSIIIKPKIQHPQQPVILWMHGLGSHCRREKEAMFYMAQYGYTSIGFDFRSHGMSGGYRGHIDSDQMPMSDVQDVVNFYKSYSADKPFFIIAHSGGALVGIRALQEGILDYKTKAMVAVAPGLCLSSYSLPWYKKLLVQVLGYIAPYANLPLRRKGHLLTSDQAMLEDDLSDPWMIKTITPRCVLATLEAMRAALQDAHKIAIPLHIVLAEQEYIIGNECSFALYDRFSCKLKKSITVFEGMKHALLREKERGKVFAHIHELLESHITI